MDRQNHATRKMPTFFISHGGGPWSFMQDDRRPLMLKLEESLAAMPAQLPRKPDGVIVVSGHWEEADFGIQSASRPEMVYDYSGFPEYTYQIQYPAPGSPTLAARTRELLNEAGLTSHLDPDRGFDHGVFAPFNIIYPDADVPLVQLSLRADYDPVAHVNLGRTLAPLRNENILLVASGLSYHNLRHFGGTTGSKASHEFDAWLNATLCESTSTERTKKLLAWERAPSARLAHPREDHLIPLLVAVGAAEGEPGVRVYHEDNFFGSLAVSSFRFGDSGESSEEAGNSDALARQVVNRPSCSC